MLAGGWEREQDFLITVQIDILFDVDNVLSPGLLQFGMDLIPTLPNN